MQGSQLTDSVEARGRRHLLFIALAVGLAHLFLGWLPLVGALVLMLAAAWIRVGILQPTSALLSPRRRTLTRWTARLIMGAALALTVVLVEALTLLPMLGLPAKALVGAAEVALAAWAVTAYVHWQLRREAQGRAIGTWEVALLAAAFAALFTACLAVIAAFAALASAFDVALGWLS